jgi:hypothetical protein
MSIVRRISPGNDIGAYCTRCKRDLTHTVLSLASEGVPERVRCNTCGSEHRYIPERSSAAPRPAPGPQIEPRARPTPEPLPEGALADAIRILLAEAGALAPSPIARKWEGGTVVLKPGDPALQPKEIPVETFFRKIVMVRDRLRVLEQQINSHDKLTDSEKISLQQYITRCYGSLTTFNLLFADREDWFVGEKKSD